MARFTGGWVKLHRSVLEKDISQNNILWALWTRLLVMATWRETQIIWNGSQRVIPPGSVSTGTKELGNLIGCSDRTVSKWLKYLNDSARIFLETCGRGTLVTICNWEVYQSTEEIDFAPISEKVRGDLAQASRGLRLIEEVKKERKKEYKYSRDELKKLIEIWQGTLSRLGIQRDANTDEVVIARLLVNQSYDDVALALLGAGFEAGSDNYDPKANVAITRLLKTTIFDKFKNLGAQHQPKSTEVTEWTT